jgi:hypothetical protein
VQSCRVAAMIKMTSSLLRWVGTHEPPMQP